METADGGAASSSAVKARRGRGRGGGVSVIREAGGGDEAFAGVVSCGGTGGRGRTGLGGGGDLSRGEVEVTTCFTACSLGAGVGAAGGEICFEVKEGRGRGALGGGTGVVVESAKLEDASGRLGSE